MSRHMITHTTLWRLLLMIMSTTLPSICLLKPGCSKQQAVTLGGFAQDNSRNGEGFGGLGLMYSKRSFELKCDATSKICYNTFSV